MKTDSCANRDEFLFPLRRKRDDMYEELLADDSDTDKILYRAMHGNLDPLKMVHGPTCDSSQSSSSQYHSWETELHRDFHNVCLKIKNLEAKLYDEAMKAR
jgi:hypothetical protein